MMMQKQTEILILKKNSRHTFIFFLSYFFFLNLHLNKAMMYKLAWMQILLLHQFVWATGV